MTLKRNVLLIANGSAGSAAATRAEHIAAALSECSSKVLLRDGSTRRTALGLIAQARRFDADLTYCVDLASVPLAVATLSHPWTPMIVDTGDYPSAFLRQVGAPQWKRLAARAMEAVAYRRSAGMVVRGKHHAAVLRGHGVRNICVIPDGVDLTVVKAVDDPALRQRLGLADVLTIGIAGHFTWYDTLGGGLGSELVHALAHTRDLRVHGVLIGDGPGLVRLRMLADELGVADRLHFIGSVPYADYGRYVSLIDIAVLTQTNDPSSWIRTTGKLPGYLALGRYVLASAVGTAADILPAEMVLPYRGRWDEQYPEHLAKRIRALAAEPARLAVGQSLTQLAFQFAYEQIAEQAATFIRQTLDGGAR